MKKLISAICCAVLMSPLTASAVNDVPAEEFPAGDVARVYINTADGNGTSLTKGTGYVSADIAVVDTDGKTVHEAGIVKVRGNSTANVAKKPYTFKYETKQNLLGMGKGKRWILLASCLDPTFLRNETALKLSRDIGIRYTSEHRYVELWLDGEYRGCYELTEPVSEGKNRVDIDVESNNGFAEFLVQYEMNRAHGGSVYCNPEGLRFEIKAPDIQSEEQRMYVRGILEKTIRIIKTGDYESIEQVIDIESFAKYYLVNEYYKNVDFGYSSAFFYYKDGILFAGPPWDYDITAGNLNYAESENSRTCLDPKGLFAHECQIYRYLWQCRDFRNAVRRIYGENRQYFEDIYREGGEIDRVISEYKPAFDRNFADTPWEVGKRYYQLMRQPDPTYEENVEYLRSWLKERNEWMNEYFDPEGDDWFDIGDIDGNSAVGVSDAVRLMKHLISEKPFTGIQSRAADMNGDGRVDTYDLVLMRQWITGEDEEK